MIESGAARLANHPHGIKERTIPASDIDRDRSRRSLEILRRATTNRRFRTALGKRRIDFRLKSGSKETGLAGLRPDGSHPTT